MNKSDEILMFLCRRHRGRQNAICSRHLEYIFDLGGRNLRRRIADLRRDGYPICSGPTGYYCAACPAEWEQYLRSRSPRQPCHLCIDPEGVWRYGH